MNLRLFLNPTFLIAALVGYIATIALFGAEFMMPIYLQAFRGRTALDAGIILLAVAATSAIATPSAGKLYDKIGPRAIMFVGFLILCINTWQLSVIQGTTPISYIVFLLALRGLAIGLTLQTSYVAALSSIPSRCVAARFFVVEQHPLCGPGRFGGSAGDDPGRFPFAQYLGPAEQNAG